MALELDFEARQRANELEDANVEKLAWAVAYLEQQLQEISDFAVGNGDVCEIIARRARIALKWESGQ